MKALILASLLLIATFGIGRSVAYASHQDAHDMITINRSSIKWVDAPAYLPVGAKVSVLYGDPSKEEMFIMRLKLPAGYKIAPHTHSKQEFVTIISGKLRIGSGEKFDSMQLRTVGTSGLFVMPALHPHFAQAAMDTVIQVQAMGPFDFKYVNPTDNPEEQNTRKNELDQ